MIFDEYCKLLSVFFDNLHKYAADLNFSCDREQGVEDRGYANMRYRNTLLVRSRSSFREERSKLRERWGGRYLM
ncbi:MAG: hypothetical protein RMY16_05180 [Nostoc sp. DedQUE12b]|uniref:hypothetical protein n=1 Tax=Nostoc sp. DedQUE12b TaxID=3075398 RepID=UPI002AD46D2C|nr:hypothetical protein [Nostoc sp. DedQUE12b]MDZ8084979.1 hypothetical protein [Nostoc sp. DedQUE12b]